MLPGVTIIILPDIVVDRAAILRFAASDSQFLSQLFPYGAVASWN